MKMNSNINGRNKCLVAFLKKPTDKIELVSALKYFKIKKLFIITDIKDKHLSLYFKFFLKKEKIKTVFLRCSFNKLSKEKLLEYVEKFEEFKYIALPISHHRAFYTSVNYFKKKNKITICISDGMSDTLSPFYYLLARHSHKSFMAVKMLLYFYFILNLSRADYCFFTCYPTRAYFAKKTLPVTKNINVDKKVINLLRKNGVTNLIIDGRGETIKSIKKKHPEIKNYCSTVRKKKQININGKIYKTKHYILAEEIINSGLIKSLYSTVSSIIFFAKNNGVKVNLVKNKFHKFRSEFFFEKYFVEKKWAEL